MRLDQVSRSEEQTPNGREPGALQIKMLEAGWDLVVFDEAHKLAAHYFGTKLEKTARFRLAERLGERSRHLLLMTATPHNGKEEDFQLFCLYWTRIDSMASSEAMAHTKSMSPT